MNPTVLMNQITGILISSDIQLRAKSMSHCRLELNEMACLRRAIELTNLSLIDNSQLVDGLNYSAKEFGGAGTESKKMFAQLEIIRCQIGQQIDQQPIYPPTEAK